MKLAIIGHSPLALEAALRFHLHGASLTWFLDQDDFSQFDSPGLQPTSFTTDLGMSLLQEIDCRYSPEVFSWKEWMHGYKRPLTDYLRAHQEVKTDEVISISKRFLAPGESISGTSRFMDLFRVIFRVNPKDFIDEQKDTNPETYKRLAEEFITSLASTIEMYQDYDLVLDLRSDLGIASASVTGRALGEGRLSEKVLYSLEALLKAKTLTPSVELREIALIGSDSLGAETLLSLSQWLKDPRSNLFVVSTEEDPFHQFLGEADPETSRSLRALLNEIEQEFQDDINTFTTKLREWQELDDFVQVKIPRPTEPLPRVNFFSGHNVTAIDELIDRKRMFLTLEKPEFRHGKRQPENNNPDLKTIGVDLILVTHSKKNRQLLNLDLNEKGFFDLIPEKLNYKNSWEKDLSKLEGIEDEIFKLFSPVDTH